MLTVDRSEETSQPLRLVVHHLPSAKPLSDFALLPRRTSIQHDRAWTALELWNHMVLAAAIPPGHLQSLCIESHISHLDVVAEVFGSRLRPKKLKPVPGGMLKGVEPEHKGGA